MMNRVRVLGGVAVVLVVLLAAGGRAGPLNPPAGAVGPTHKTLTEVEPRTPIGAATTPGDANSLFKITQPGSYYLTGNVQGVAGKWGIWIEASGVTVDLMGFELAGVAGSGQGIGTAAQSNFRDVTIRNGVVRGWGSTGVTLPNRSVAADLIITGCALGLRCGQETRLERCTVVSNTGKGTSGSGSGVAVACQFSRNGGAGMDMAGGWVVEGCAADINGGDGFVLGDWSVVRGCRAAANTGDGISVEGMSVVVDNVSVHNEDGATSAAGIRLRGTGSLAAGNTCAGNFQGILVEASDNRVEGNSCTGNGIGFDVDGSGNFISRNTASGNNTNWAVVAGNAIYVVQAAPAGIVVGDSGGLSPGSTNPNANFTY